MLPAPRGSASGAGPNGAGGARSGRTSSGVAGARGLELLGEVLLEHPLQGERHGLRVGFLHGFVARRSANMSPIGINNPLILTSSHIHVQQCSGDFKRRVGRRTLEGSVSIQQVFVVAFVLPMGGCK